MANTKCRFRRAGTAAPGEERLLRGVRRPWHLPKNVSECVHDQFQPHDHSGGDEDREHDLFPDGHRCRNVRSRSFKRPQQEHPSSPTSHGSEEDVKPSNQLVLGHSISRSTFPCHVVGFEDRTGPFPAAKRARSTASTMGCLVQSARPAGSAGTGPRQACLPTGQRGTLTNENPAGPKGHGGALKAPSYAIKLPGLSQVTRGRLPRFRRKRPCIGEQPRYLSHGGCSADLNLSKRAYE
jgi:hypothetical protein